MALSVLDRGFFVTCANPVFPISDEGDRLTFEVLEKDATSLKQRLGKMDNYCLDDGPFSGELISLELCRSTHIGLSLLRYEPTLRGVMKIHKPSPQITQ